MMRPRNKKNLVKPCLQALNKMMKLIFIEVLENMYLKDNRGKEVKLFKWKGKRENDVKMMLI